MLEPTKLEYILGFSSGKSPLVIGKSREGRPIHGYRFGNGALRISLIGGCHADEPTGPRFLSHLTGFLESLDHGHPLLQGLSWWIVPQVNPDGEHRNQAWYAPDDEVYNLAKNLKHALRELPGDDVEFGFPLPPDIASLRPENQAIYEFWKTAKTRFDLHVSLHGMRQSYGPWFLLDKDFNEELGQLKDTCREEVQKLGYQLHDVDRRGEKGFYRLGEGFGSRPNSMAMREYFHNQGNPEMAEKFHASSMESIRSLGDPCLTLVTEMPLFILPREHKSLQWPDAILTKWSERMNRWKLQLQSGQISEAEVLQEAGNLGLKAMPIKDQMHLQWVFIWAGIQHQLRNS